MELIQTHVGETFGYLTIIDDSVVFKNKGRRFNVTVQCICGNTFKSLYSSFLQRKGHDCGSHGNFWYKRIDPHGILYEQYKDYLRLDNSKFALDPKIISLQSFYNISDFSCVFCGGVKDIISGQNSILGCGLDRLNNTLGYTRENTVPCCKVCNRGKSNMIYKEWLDHLRGVGGNKAIIKVMKRIDKFRTEVEYL